jgi:FkbM family methyltransferase
MVEDLIFDLGAHVGDDTGFYLAKGFRVVAIEAHPDFVCQLRHRFANEIKSGRLCVINVAIAENFGLAELLESQVDRQWSTIDSSIAQAKPGNFRPVLVPAIPFNVVLDHFGVPYYLKVDIEGSEKHVFQHLHASNSLPRHVSYEAGSDWAALASSLQQLGYSQFKLVNQANVHDASLPSPALEGKYVDWQFRGYTSGPFGFESPGAWMDSHAFIPQAYKYLTERVKPGDWFDIHATR